MALVDPSWMPPAQMKRVICHWTGGPHRANAVDRKAYHILVEVDGRLRRGDFPIHFNERIIQSRGYAAHTKGTNTGSIGVSCCSMLNCNEKPFRAGPAPMSEVQFNTMTKVVAELCRRYNIAVTPRTVLGHGEVQATLGVQQNNKWDPMVLPWKLDLTRAQVGALLRRQVSEHLQALGGGLESAPGGLESAPRAEAEEELEAYDDAPLPVRVRIGGREVEGVIHNEDLLVRASDAPQAGYESAGYGDEEETVEIGGETYVSTRGFAPEPEYEEETETFVIP